MVSDRMWQCRGPVHPQGPGSGGRRAAGWCSSPVHKIKQPIEAVLRIHDILRWIRIRGSMPLTNWSGSCYFRQWPSRCQQKTNFLTIFSAYYFLKVHLHHFSKIKSQKESQNSMNQCFSYYFCMMIEGSRSGFIDLTSGSGSGRAKNMWIRWIRIRNTGLKQITR